MKPILAFVTANKNGIKIEEAQTILDKMTELFNVGEYQIPDEETVIYRIQRKGGVPFTVLEIVNPEDSEGLPNESTVTLMRKGDSEHGGAHFLDLYNNGYDDSRQMGIRVQSRGANGKLFDFIFDFFDGITRTEVMRVTTTEVDIEKPLVLSGSDRGTLKNEVSGMVLDFFNNGNTVYYCPTGDFYIYMDEGNLYINDRLVQGVHSGNTASRPSWASTGYQYYDTTLGKPIWKNGTVWKDAAGVTV